MRLYRLFVSLSLLFADLSLFSSQPKVAPWKNKTRVKALEHADLLLNYWNLFHGPHPLPSKTELLAIDWPELRSFSSEYGYFSPVKPLVGKVSMSPSDILLVSGLLATFPYQHCDEKTFLFAQAEVLTKILAYRDLIPGQTFFLPVTGDRGIQIETFTVDKVFNIWKGMPAFGLIPSSPHLSSLLLFRGTDFSPITKRGLASMISDLDPAGPGLHAFLHARRDLKEWLKKRHREDKPARVLGFSLGGALASYTFIYASSLLSKEPSIAICPPGVGASVKKSFSKLPKERQSGLITYINAGDFVSGIGKLFGTVYCLSTEKPLRPLTAHTTLFTAVSPLYRCKISSSE